MRTDTKQTSTHGRDPDDYSYQGRSLEEFSGGQIELGWKPCGEAPRKAVDVSSFVFRIDGQLSNEGNHITFDSKYILGNVFSSYLWKEYTEIPETITRKWKTEDIRNWELTL